MSDWPYFPEIPEGMDSGFMSKLIMLRQEMNFPFPVTSSLRSDNRHSLHNFGKAVDIHVFGENAYKLIAAAPRFGMVGVGIKQHGPLEGRFVHLDDGGEDFPRPRVWSYK